MTDFFTTRQLQELLQLDRTTIYRMLNEGRLPGFKVGGRWRFSRKEIDAWLEVHERDTTAAHPAEHTDQLSEDVRPSVSVLPISCLQGIQNVFASALNIGAITTYLDGQPLTEISNSCAFCSLILSSEEGRNRCIASWRALARQPVKEPLFRRCHAGLLYARGRIEIEHEFVGMFFAGQLADSSGQSPLNDKSVQELASVCHVAPESLREATNSIRVISEVDQARTLGLLAEAADTLSSIGHERMIMVNKLRRIASISSI